MDKYTKSLFSRQIGAIGKNSMEKLMNTNVLIIGTNMISVEFTKCVSLLGIKKLVIVEADDATTKGNKIFNHFHISGNGKDKAENMVSFAKTLNPSIDCIKKKVVSGENLTQVINNITNTEQIDILVYTEIILGLSLEAVELISLSNNAKFVCGFNHGLEGYVFSNFGEHTILDLDGEITQTAFIENYVYDKQNIHLTIEKLTNTLISKHGYLVDRENQKVQVDVISSSLESITIAKKSEIVTYLDKNKERNIRFIEVKDIIDKKYKNLSDYLKIPNQNIITLDSSFDISETNIDNKAKYANRIKNAIDSKKEYINIGYYNQFPILGAIIGGILSHEVIKTTGKYTPLDQDIYFDFRKLNSSLYNDALYEKQKNVLDKTLCKRLSELNIFMVGCGALGCEISKNLGMLNVSTKNKGLLTITDMDTIELSNLNRQFLFRNENIGNHKSTCVKERLQEYFSKMKVKSFTHEVGSTTENIFNTGFWKNNDIVINALDNVEARQYVDSRCVLYEKPLFESGTQGSKCNTQTIIPHKTATYSEIIDLDDSSIPMCTIKSFPNKTEHCVEWAIDIFDKIISQPLSDIDSFINNRKQYLTEINSLNDNQKRERCSILLEYIELYKTRDFECFLEFCHNIYTEYFKNPIKDVLYSFPESLTDDYGNKFWSGKKIKPQLIGFREANHRTSIVKELYNILEDRLSLKPWDSDKYTRYFSQEYKEEDGDYKCKKITVDEEKDEISVNHNDEQFSDGYNKICTILFKKKQRITSVKYDKDDDSLLKVMSSITNIRSLIYSIGLSDSQDIKMISGRIIPALSTTTTIISAFVILEMLKHMCNLTSSDTNINLGTNSYIVFDSQKPKVTYNNMLSEIYGMKIKTVPENFNTWKRWRISIEKDDCVSVSSLLNILKSDYDIEPSSLNIDKLVIYDSSKKHMKDTNIYDIYKKLNKPLSEYLEINLGVYDEIGIPILTPMIILSI